MKKKLSINENAYVKKKLSIFFFAPNFMVRIAMGHLEGEIVEV